MDHGNDRKCGPEGTGSHLDPAAGRTRHLCGIVDNGSSRHEDTRRGPDQDNTIKVSWRTSMYLKV